jgi:hypothetical protein
LVPTYGSVSKSVVTFVVTDGQQGEDNDYFADHCDGVTATIAAVSGATYADYVALSGLTAAEIILLKACLGDADGIASNNVEVYNWDYGSAEYPHLIKLVRTVTSYQDGGYYAALVWNSGTTDFRLVNPFVPPDAAATDTYDIYTTKGVLRQTAATAAALFGYGSKQVVTTVTGLQTSAAELTTVFHGDISCENYMASAGYAAVNVCMNASDLFTVLSYASPQANSPYINLYTAKRVWTTPYKYIGQENTLVNTGNALSQLELRRGTHTIETDLSMNWGADDKYNTFNVYKFTPARASTYNYVAACSNRGVCQTDSGVCACFPGYTGDSCSTQNSLAL